MRNMDLSKNQLRAIEAMLQTPTQEAAGRLAGLTARTLRNYLKDEAFCEALRRRRAEVAQDTSNALIGLANRGASALWELLDDPATPPGIRARVGIEAQTLARNAVELDDVLDRLAAIEKSIAERGEQ